MRPQPHLPTIYCARSNRTKILPFRSAAQGDVTIPSINQDHITSSTGPLAAIVHTLSKYKKKRQLALKKREATGLELPQDPKYDPDDYLQLIKKPEELGIGRNAEVTQKLIQSLAEFGGGQTQMPSRRDRQTPVRGQKKKKTRIRTRKRKRENPFNINIIRQQYCFAP